MITSEQAAEALMLVLRNKGVTGVEVKPESRLDELELDSLDLAEVLVILEEQAGVELDERGGLVTVADLAALSRGG